MRFQRAEVRTKECNLQRGNYNAPRRAGNSHRRKGLSGEPRGFSPLQRLRGHLDDVCVCGGAGGRAGTVRIPVRPSEALLRLEIRCMGET